MLTSVYFNCEPSLRHGFFTRTGGVSTGIYESLNCGTGSQDNPKAVAENRRRACTKLKLSPTSLVTLQQVHSADTVTITEPMSITEDSLKADSMVTRTPGVALGILTADCAPILFADIPHGVIGAAHAGWKGSLLGIIEKTVSAMQQIGATRKSIIASVGPCIAQASYQVSADFRHPFIGHDPGASLFFQPEIDTGKYLFDLRGYIRTRLTKMGLGTIDSIENDTYSEEELFFSCRRNFHHGQSDYGRVISVIALVNPN